MLPPTRAEPYEARQDPAVPARGKALSPIEAVRGLDGRQAKRAPHVSWQKAEKAREKTAAAVPPDQTRRALAAIAGEAADRARLCPQWTDGRRAAHRAWPGVGSREPSPSIGSAWARGRVRTPAAFWRKSVARAQQEGICPPDGAAWLLIRFTPAAGRGRLPSRRESPTVGYSVSAEVGSGREGASGSSVGGAGSALWSWRVASACSSARGCWTRCGS